MKKLITISLLFFFAAAVAQEPAMLSIEGIGGNGSDGIFRNVITTSDGGGIVAFHTSSDQGTGNINTQCNQTTASKSSVFRKYDGWGNIEWEKCFPRTDDTEWIYINPLPDGGFILGGGGYIDQQYRLRREDATGNILWSKSYGGSAGELIADIKPTADGGYIMLGSSNSSNGDVGFHYGGVFSLDLWVLKVDSNGDKQWGKVIGGTDDERGLTILSTPGNGYYVFGTSSSTDYDAVGNHGGGDIFVARLDDTGVIIWSKCLGGSSFDGYLSAWAVEDGNGGLLFATRTYSMDGDVINNHGNADFWLVGLDSSANIVLNKCYGTAASENAYSIAKTTDGTIWIAGTAGMGTWILQTDIFGNILSEKFFNVTSGSCATNLLMRLQSGMVLAGGFYSGPGVPGGDFPTEWYGSNDAFIAKFAPWTTSATTVRSANSFRVYPNPSSDKVLVDVTGGKEYNVTITDVLGRKVYSSGRHMSAIEISVRLWTRGIYYVQVAIDGNYYNTQLVVQ